jgi:tetratricopeptide (TPR) repeat protein
MAEAVEPEEGADARAVEILDQMGRAMREGRTGDAEDAMRAMTAYAMEQARNWHSPQSDYLQEAADCQERADWDGARDAFERAIAVANRPAMEYYARAKLVAHYTLVGDVTEALEEARRSRDAANREEIRLVRWMGLYDHANAARDAGALDEARASSDACLAIVKDIMSEGQPLPHHMMRTRVLRAHVAMDGGDFDAARRELSAVPAPVPDTSRRDLAGISAAEARWWAASALLRRHAGDTDGAVEACRQAVALRRAIVESTWSDEPVTRRIFALTLERLSETLSAAGRLSEAVECGAEGRAILSALQLPPAGPSQTRDGMVE